MFSPEELLDCHRDATICIGTSKYAKEVEDYLIEHEIPKDHLVQLRPYLFFPTNDLYFDLDFIRLEEHEIFVDAGCKNLGTTVNLARRCKHLDKVYAFEPDPANFSLCVKRRAKENLLQVDLYPYGTWSERGTIHFDARGDGTSRIIETGGTMIGTTTIDEIVGDGRVTFIKMDVEGAELESLKGARNTILSQRPKLAVCIYHKPEDILTLPLYIRELVPEYKFYIRHHGNAANEAVLYAV